MGMVIVGILVVGRIKEKTGTKKRSELRLQSICINGGGVGGCCRGRWRRCRFREKRKKICYSGEFWGWFVIDGGCWWVLAEGDGVAADFVKESYYYVERFRGLMLDFCGGGCIESATGRVCVNVFKTGNWDAK